MEFRDFFRASIFAEVGVSQGLKYQESRKSFEKRICMRIGLERIALNMNVEAAR